MTSGNEQQRLDEARTQSIPWRKWGPYLSERQWGTVREDYSQDGNAWAYFSHDQARSRAYRWGEDGLAGISDDRQLLCFALALWNGVDPILKERLFGLTNAEGNHGEDVKEYYFYLDSTPTHSYMKYLYKYPQVAYPYADLISASRHRSRSEPEYELIDSGVFDQDRYFDVFVEYAKTSPEEILIRITAHNRGPEEAKLRVLPTLWFRNTWAGNPAATKPSLRPVAGPQGASAILASHPDLGDRYLYVEGETPLLFTENETNLHRIAGVAGGTPYAKDGINDYVVRGATVAVNPGKVGTKAAADHQLTIPAHGEATVRLRLTNRAPEAFANADAGPFGTAFDQAFTARQEEADEFYRSITPAGLHEGEARVMREALAGMLWSKQFYGYDLAKWLEQHGIPRMDPLTKQTRNAAWFHMVNNDVISMPDKWEYPWYAAWDLAFHTVPLAMVDLDFAKQQLDMMLRELYLHPSGQMPAYEWNFGDVNPPVHAMATIMVYEQEKARYGKGDLDFLKRSFNKLMLNFTWWVNRKDRDGRNVFEGGFLGLDNIGVFDRSAPLPTGGHLEQADGTAWMAMFCQNMLQIGAELTLHDRAYQDMAIKFAEHFVWIAAAMNRVGTDGQGLWDEEDGFYYDVLQLPDGTATRLKVRSLVGLLPLCATTVIEKNLRDAAPEIAERARHRLMTMPDLMNHIHPTGPGHFGVKERGILALVRPERLRRILTRMLDENEFLGPHGIRSISRYHLEHPYIFNVGGQEYSVNYLPAESDTGLFGGNSNWRGPVWFPVNLLLVRGLRQFHLYYGDSFKIECPTGSGCMMNLGEVANEIMHRLVRTFLPDATGRRPVVGGIEKFQTDPYWRDLPWFYEYFHGDNGAGIGASHQTGWTGLVAKLLQLLGEEVPETLSGSVAGTQKRRASAKEVAAPSTLHEMRSPEDQSKAPPAPGHQREVPPKERKPRRKAADRDKTSRAPE
jgi:Mannosylglycerate hydrolase MGH1-like glycoside hydrolase domain